MTFAQKLFELRAALKLSQGKFAKKLGTSQANISSYESGNRVPSYAMLMKLKEFCSNQGIDVHWV